MPQYQVVDINAVDEANSPLVHASTPERAAEIVLGVSLVRSGQKRNLRAQVYCQKQGEALTMVRLYSRVSGNSASE